MKRKRWNHEWLFKSAPRKDDALIFRIESIKAFKSGALKKIGRAKR